MTFGAKLKIKLMTEHGFDVEKRISAESAWIDLINDDINKIVAQRVRLEVTAFAHLISEGFTNGGTIEEFQAFKDSVIANYPDMSTFDYWAFWRKANHD